MRRATHRLRDLVLTDHEFSLPLDQEQPDGEQVTVFAREAVAPGREDEQLPWLVFLQGGPGGESPRPVFVPETWLEPALERYRVLLLDQRGTGLSTPVSGPSVEARGTPEAQAAYLGHFRADSIVRDAEAIRQELSPDEPWSILGQSYGGFCALTYLSFAPEGLRAAFFTGGLAPVDRTIDEVYRATYPRVLDRNSRYYERYPGDADRVRAIVERLDGGDVRFPDGTPLTSHRFRAHGIVLGMSDGAEVLHYLVERGVGDRLLRELERAETFEISPIYAILHESIYCQGAPSRWSAERLRTEFPEVDDPDAPVVFTGEMVYPWMFEDYAALRPLRKAAEVLAARDDWPPLYDLDVLRRNEVPCAAAVYANDMYVERALSEETAELVPCVRTWVTEEYEHDALRKHGDVVLRRLFDLIES